MRCAHRHIRGLQVHLAGVPPGPRRVAVIATLLPPPAVQPHHIRFCVVKDCAPPPQFAVPRGPRRIAVIETVLEVVHGYGRRVGALVKALVKALAYVPTAGPDATRSSEGRMRPCQIHGRRRRLRRCGFYLRFRTPLRNDDRPEMQSMRHERGMDHDRS